MNHLVKVKKAATKLGFTLIELSIVLVIIGLIVGGILVGQDLIKAAEIRATVSQMEKYATAVNTFRSKYNGVPGDLLNAANFGFDTRTGGNGIGDGDSIIESSANDTGTFAGEASCFWDDLTAASMIAESLNSSAACSTSQATLLATSLPQTKLGRSNYLMVGNNGGINYWAITGISALATGFVTTDDLLTPSEAFQIDSKIDDGGATSGSVQATDDTGAGDVINGRGLFNNTDVATAAAEGVCIAPGGLFNFVTTSGNSQGCQMRLRSNF